MHWEKISLSHWRNICWRPLISCNIVDAFTSLKYLKGSSSLRSSSSSFRVALLWPRKTQAAAAERRKRRDSGWRRRGSGLNRGSRNDPTCIEWSEGRSEYRFQCLEKIFLTFKYYAENALSFMIKIWYDFPRDAGGVSRFQLRGWGSH